MRKLVLLLSILFAISALKAQQDPKAKEILDKLSLTTKAYKTIQIDFSFNMENKKNKINDTNEGQITLKGKNYRLHMPAFGMDVFCDGTTSWSYLTDAKECNVNSVEEEKEGALNPATIFTIYESGYKYSYIGEESLGAKQVQVVDLFPEDKTKEIVRVRLYIDKSKSQIAKAVTFNKDGNTYTLLLKNMKTNIELKDEFFKFDKTKYPGVTINDMR